MAEVLRDCQFDVVFDMVLVFPRTIIEIDRRIEKLEREIEILYEQGNEAYSGGDTWHSAGFRFLEQHRIAQEETLRTLKKLRKNARVIQVPSDKVKISLAHLVTVTDVDTGAAQKFHICGSDDAAMLSDECETSGERMLSDVSVLGRKLLGKKVGDVVNAGGREMRIEGIEVSGFVEDRAQAAVSNS